MTTKEIKELVEGELGYRINVDSRKRDIVYGRAIYFRICKDRTNLSLKKIGQTLNKDHASVLHSINNIFPAFEMYNPKYMEIYNRIIATEEYIPKHQKLKTLQEEHRKTRNKIQVPKKNKNRPKVKTYIRNNTRDTRRPIPSSRI